MNGEANNSTSSYDQFFRSLIALESGHELVVTIAQNGSVVKHTLVGTQD